MVDERVTIREAAIRLGVSEGAVRKRVDRGTLRSEKVSDGRVYVFVPGGEDASTTHESNALTSRMEDEIAYLRAELDKRSEEIGRRDAIIMQLSQANAELSRTVRELEAPKEQQEAPTEAQDQAQEPAEGEAGVESRETVSRPWWWRWLG